MQLKIEREALTQGGRRRLPRPAGEAGEGAGRPRGTLRRDDRSAGRRRRARSSRRQKLKEELDKARTEVELAQRRGDLGRAVRAAVRRHPAAREEARRRRRRRRAAGERGGDRGRHRRRGLAAGPASRSRRCWRASAPSCCKMEDQLRKRVVGQEEALEAVSQGGAPRARRAAGPEPADRQLPVPRPDRRRQDRAGEGAGRASCSTTSGR